MRAPRLEASRSLRHQIEATGLAHDRDRYADLVGRTFANRGSALVALRDVVYEILELDPPARPPRLLAVSVPASQQLPVMAHLVIDVSSESEPEVRVRLERYPATLEPEAGRDSPGRHLLVDEREPDVRLRESAAVIVRRTPPSHAGGEPADEAASWVQTTLARYPGSRIAAACVNAGRIVLGARDGPVLEANASGGLQDIVAFTASAAYVRLVRGDSTLDLAPGFIAQAGAGETHVRITQRSSVASSD